MYQYLNWINFAFDWRSTIPLKFMTPFNSLQKTDTNKKNRYFFGTLFVFTCILFCACSKTPGNPGTTAPTADENFCREDAGSYNTVMSEQFRKNDSTIMVLKTAAGLKKPQEIPEFTRQLLVLEATNIQMKRDMDHYQYINKKEWLMFRKTFSGQLDTLSASLTELGNWWN